MSTLRTFDWGAFSFSGADTLTFAVDADTSRGELGVIIICEQGSNIDALDAPDGWELQDWSQGGSSSRSTAVYAKFLDEDDAGTSVVFTSNGNIAVGVLLILQGAGIQDCIVDPGGFVENYAISTTSHPMPDTRQTQADDVRFLLWVFENYTITMTLPVAAGLTDHGQLSDSAASGWKLGLAEYRTGVVGTAGSALTATGSGNVNGFAVNVAIRSRAVARPDSIVSDHNGNIGLTE
jgi:hypothetical protein